MTAKKITGKTLHVESVKTKKVGVATKAPSAKTGLGAYEKKRKRTEEKKKKKARTEMHRLARERERAKLKEKNQTERFIVKQKRNYAKKHAFDLYAVKRDSSGREALDLVRSGGYGGQAGQDWEGTLILTSAEVDFILNKAMQIVAEAYSNLSEGGSVFETWYSELAGARSETHLYEEYIKDARARAETFTNDLDDAVSRDGKYNIAIRIESYAGDFFTLETSYIYTYDPLDAVEMHTEIIRILSQAVRGEVINNQEMKKRIKVQHAGELGEFQLAEALENGWLGTDDYDELFEMREK